MPPSSCTVSVVSQTHSSYGPWGTPGLCYILPYKQANRHPQHARIFLPLFSSYVYFYSLKQNRSLGSVRQGPTFSSFCGNNNIVFHEAVPSVLGNSLQTIWSGLFFWSKAVQSRRRKSRLKLLLWLLRWQSKKAWSLGLNWTYDPVCVWVCIWACVFVVIIWKCPVLHLQALECFAIVNANIVSAGLCAFFGSLLCISKSIESCV